ncbi:MULTISPECIES: hypothetical protein [Microbacterium]|uniref:hypothetical protein n=1 Tax=Microbacterium TaxID=33882 RepID=UPI00217E0F77|nr:MULTISPECIES: hypothetical protein [Microbacterium]UWF78080.1 hypothetical protein JSY13_03305 [Microbacterium neungamense]WCM56258.1 hypothetical protein JRG78_03330 [Microbacterium sp. EF45047]
MKAPQLAFQVHHAVVTAGDGADARERVLAVLRQHRILAALRGGGRSGPEAAVLLPVTQDGAVLALAADDRLSFGITVADLRAGFAAEGLALALGESADADPVPGGDEGTDAAHVDGATEGLTDDATEDLTEVLADDGQRDEDLLADDAATAQFAQEHGASAEPVRVAEFSHRGPWAARLTAQILGVDVEYLEDGDWSLYRYRTDRPHGVITGAGADGLVVELNLPVHGEAWVEVTVPAGETAFFWPNAERETRPTLDVEAIAVPEIAELYRRMLTEADGLEDEIALLGRDVDAEAVRRACIPESLGGVAGERERLTAFLTAFGVPPSLAAAALPDADSLPAPGDEAPSAAATRRFAPQGWPAVIGGILVGGLSETVPLTARSHPVARLARALERRPQLAAAASTAEIAAGVALLRGRSGLARVIGALAVLDGLADLGLLALRIRRR